MKWLTLISALLFVAPAFAGKDCTYRITGTDSTDIKVVPSGFTGKMSCSSAQLEKIVVDVTKALEEKKMTDASITLSDLHDFWSIRSDLAKELSTDKDWDAKKGKKKDGAGGVVTSTLLNLLDPMFVKHGYRVTNLILEQFSVEDASKQGFKEIKGIYPFAGKLVVTLQKN